MRTSVVIVGGGPGGSSTAMQLARRGIRSIIVEKTAFPRYHIGESLTGECGLALRELGLEPRMVDRGHPIKRGVTVYGPSARNAFHVPVKGYRPGTGLFDTHTWSVPRDGFDRMLLDGAVEGGAMLVAGEAIRAIVEDGAVRGIEIRNPDGTEQRIEAEITVDASGASTFLCRCGLTGEKSRGRYDKQLAVFSQVENAVRDPGDASGNTLIFYLRKHHWAWFIPLDERRTSVGVVVPSDYYRSRGESSEVFLARELNELNPELARRLPERRLVEPVRCASSYSYRVREFTGPGFLCVGDAHRFIDPVFSFGVFFSMKEGEFAAEAIARNLTGGGGDAGDPFRNYRLRCERGQGNVESLIDAFWCQPYAFSVFTHHRYPQDIIDLFAGRVYDEAPSPGLSALRALNASEHARARA